MNYDNPAARLHAILSDGMNADRNKPCRQVWAELLGAPQNDAITLFSRLGRVMALPIETSELVATHFPSLSSSIDLWQAPVEAAFLNQQISGKWETFAQHINPYCVPQLATLAELLHTKLGSLLAEHSSVTKLTEQLAELILAVESNDLLPELKLHLLKELGNLRLTLNEYTITGSAPAIRQAEALVGHMHRDKRFLDFMTSHEIGKRVLENLNAVVGVLTVYVAIAQISSPGFSLLPR